MPDEPDGCVVRTAPLSLIVREYMDNYRKKRPSLKGTFGYENITDVDPLTPLAALAFDTGLRENDIKKVMNPVRNPRTELHVADALVAAIGDPMMFHDGTLEIKPNAKARPSRRAECCGHSSLTGALTSGARGHISN